MDDLVHAAQALSAVLSRQDEGSRFGFQLHERLPVLLALRNQLDAALARTVRHGELSGLAGIDGQKTMASWLRGHGRLSGAAAHKLVTVGRALDHLPAAATAFADGAVTADQVAVLGQVATEAHRTAADTQGIDLDQVDQTLTALAAAGTHQQTVLAVGHYLSRLDPDGPEPDPTEDRSLTLSARGDGTHGIHGQLDGIGGEKLRAALESIAQADRSAGDTRTRAQQLADALVQLCDNQLAGGQLPVLRGRKPQVTVLIPWVDLVDPTTGPGASTMGFGTSLSAARARLLACDGDVARIVVGPDSQPLDLGRTHRVVPAHLRKAVELRDGACVFAGCGAPKFWCDVHHVVHWVDGGPTDLDNSALLCERHHTKVHHGFRVERQSDNSHRTYRPDGTEILVGPRITPDPPGGPPESGDESASVDLGPPSDAGPPRTPDLDHDGTTGPPLDLSALADLRPTARAPVDLDSLFDLDLGLGLDLGPTAPPTPSPARV